MICEITGSECKFQELKDSINNLRSMATTAKNSGEKAPEQQGFRDLTGMADFYTNQANKLQADLNSQACGICPNKTS